MITGFSWSVDFCLPFLVSFLASIPALIVALSLERLKRPRLKIESDSFQKITISSSRNQQARDQGWPVRRSLRRKRRGRANRSRRGLFAKFKVSNPIWPIAALRWFWPRDPAQSVKVWISIFEPCGCVVKIGPNGQEELAVGWSSYGNQDMSTDARSRTDIFPHRPQEFHPFFYDFSTQQIYGWPADREFRKWIIPRKLFILRIRVTTGNVESKACFRMELNSQGQFEEPKNLTPDCEKFILTSEN